ncbi:MAG: 23S rRNA (uracil(1939)-C(5))-methyltransferase RlmD [Eubacterium sp.]|nr:23S rRNA (uracil(1939)-C(5))-methyltransferase RlmD [Eubacterium sp.]
MNWKKNDLVTVRIEDIGINGEGIGKIDGFTVFVRDAVPGDLAEVRLMKLKKHYGYARLIHLLEESDTRVEPVCPAAGPCGGCQLQHLSYEAQLAWKEQQVRNDLIRIGGFENPPMLPVVGMDSPLHYRNKAQFPVGYDREGRLAAGLFAAHSHRIIPLVTAEDEETEAAGDITCRIGKEVNTLILKTILNWMQKYRISAYREETHDGIVRHVLIRSGYHTDEVLVCLVINAGKLPHSEVLADMLYDLKCGIVSLSFSSNTKRTNVILGDNYHVIRGEKYMTDRIGRNQFQISPLSFYQVNPQQTERLYQKAVELAQLTGKETVFDLYCGIGTISLALAEKAKQVFGVEIVPQAIEDARRNAVLNGIENVSYYVGKAEEVVPQLYRASGIRADVVVVDPPRKGCDAALLETMISMQPERIVYVSCNPSTLARDLKVLCSSGFRLVSVQPFDQFSMTTHVECKVLLAKCTF